LERIAYDAVKIPSTREGLIMSVKTRIVAALSFAALAITALIFYVPVDQVLIQTEVICASSGVEAKDAFDWSFQS